VGSTANFSICWLAAHNKNVKMTTFKKCHFIGFTGEGSPFQAVTGSYAYVILLKVAGWFVLSIHEHTPTIEHDD
jgi:hypothetical protein